LLPQSVIPELEKEGKMSLRLVLAADHGGFVLKANLIPWFEDKQVEIQDEGAYIFDAQDDYPDYAEVIADAVRSGRADRGILICGSGVGAAIAVNKFPGIRACLCHDTYSAHQGVEHDDMNVLCLGGRVVGLEMAKELVSAFISASFNQSEKYCRRAEEVKAIEKRFFKSVEYTP
jgi:ribose 5-phosphate isomerase B